jgi:hypothetical protein
MLDNEDAKHYHLSQCGCKNLERIHMRAILAATNLARTSMEYPIQDDERELCGLLNSMTRVAQA